MYIKKTSLVIPTKDRPDKVFRILKSFEEYILLFNEILIIDSSADYNNENIINGCKKYKNIKIIKSKPSSSLQRNVGIDQFNKNNQFIMFCDDDIIFDKNSLIYMDKFIEKFPDNIGYGFNLIEKDYLNRFDFFKNHKFFQNNGFYNENPGIVCENGWHTKISNINKDTETMWLSTQACIYKSDYIKNNFLFDTSLGKYSYLEDLFFSYEIKKKGKLSICCRAKYSHPNNIERVSFKFGIKEIVNRHKFVKINSLNIKKFYISAFIKSLLNLISFISLRKNLLPRFCGNIFGIFLCILK
tara:strand:+ start:2524 stop:3420 length:897 start_codon:yes stop_codon:yes gene_type:complete